MSKERLEEIKNLRETILEENDFRTRCVLASVFVGLGFMDYLIKQAERVQELEEDLTKYRNGLEFQLLINNSIKKQNKRYREALEKIKQKGELMNYSTGRESYNGQAEIARKALEDDDDEQDRL